MKVQIKRPVIWVAISYIVGIFLSSLIEEINWFFWIIPVFLLLIIFYWLKKNIGYSVLGMLLLFIWIGIVNAQIARTDFSELNRFESLTSDFTGQIVEVIQQDKTRAVYNVRVECVEFDAKRYTVKGKIRLTEYFDGDNENIEIFDVGDLVKVRGELKKPQGVRNPKGFDYRAYLQRQGIFYTMSVNKRQIELLGSKPFRWPHSWVLGVHNWMQGMMEKNIRDPGLSLVKSMIIGDKGMLPSELKNEFSETGLAHILAISGLHVGFIVLLLSFLQKIFKLPPKAAFAVQTLLLSFYCFVIGAPASAVRATIMAMIVLGGRLLGREPDSINSMALSALIILLFRPLDLFDLGFQLSFAAVGGIFLYSDIIKKLFKFLPDSLSNSVSVTLSAQIGTWPLIAYYFNIISPLALIANLLMVPVAGIIVILGFIMLIVSAILPWLGSFLGYIIEYISLLLIKGNSLIASIPWSSLKIISPSVIFLIVYYWVLWIMSDEKPLFIKRPWLWSSCAAALLLTIMILKSLLPVPLQIIFLDVGQGDCIYIRTSDRKNILIDGGGRPYGTGNFDVGDNIVVPFLLKNGIWRLDLVVMSHAHDDHIGGLIPVVRDLKVNTFMEYPPRDISPNYLYLKELVERKGITCIYAAGVQKYRIGRDVWLDILYPVGRQNLIQIAEGDNENNRSLVIRLRYGNTSVLFTGDIEKEVEDYLSDIYNFRVDILKVAHHGSRTSSTEAWIEVLRPRIAVIQVGNNMFGHPHPEVEDRLTSQGAMIYRNDRDGAVICSFSNGKWNISTMVQN